MFSPGENLHENSSINDISWNRKVPHILASASSNGIAVIWDLKMNKAIFSFNDNKKFKTNRKVSLSWNPEIPTQIGVVYDDETSPELQIWDLRNPQGPIFASEKVHMKGIHSMDWCLTDSSLIATLGRDNKVCFWNYKSTENNLVDEKSLHEPGNKLKWSPRLPAVYSVTNKSSTTVFSMNEQNVIDTNNISTYAPKWLKPPVGARFSFDGKLAVFSEKGGSIVKQYQIVNTDSRLEPLIIDFEKNFLSTRLDINQLCDNRINSEFLDDKDKEEWKFIKAVAKNDPDEIISALGLDKEKIIKKTEKYTGKSHGQVNNQVKKKKVELGYDNISETEAFNFFDTLAQKDPKKKAPIVQDGDDNVDSQFVIQETVHRNTNWNAGIEKYIKDNILIGNIEGAVDAALQHGRTAEAFLIAFSKGPELFKSTIKHYFVGCNEPFIKTVIKGLIDGVSDLVKNHNLEDWKECVALGLNYTDPKGFPAIMEQLANRLVNEKEDHDSSLLCFILSKNFGRILENLAYRTEHLIKGSIEHTSFLFRTVEKLTAMRIISGQLETNPILDRFVFETSKLLHTAGRHSVLLNIMTINDCRSFDCLVMRDRILHSNPDLLGLYPSKPFPFRQENVGVKTRKQEQPTQHQHQHQTQNQNLRQNQPSNVKANLPAKSEEKPGGRAIFDPSKVINNPVNKMGPPIFKTQPQQDQPTNTPPPITGGSTNKPPSNISSPFVKDSTATPNNMNQFKPVQREEEKEISKPKPNVPPPKTLVGPTRTFTPGGLQDPKNIVESKPNDLPPPKTTTTTNQFANDVKPPTTNNNPNLASFGNFGTNNNNLSGSNTFNNSNSPFGGNINQNTTTTTSTTQPINKFQPPPMNKPSFPKPNIPTTTSNPSTLTSSNQNMTNSNQFSSPQQTISSPTQNYGPPPTNFNKPGPGGFKAPPPNQKVMPKPNMSSTTSFNTTTTTSSTQLLTDADLPENCALIYETVMRGIDVLDQIDVKNDVILFTFLEKS